MNYYEFYLKIWIQNLFNMTLSKYEFEFYWFYLPCVDEIFELLSSALLNTNQFGWDKHKINLPSQQGAFSSDQKADNIFYLHTFN